MNALTKYNFVVGDWIDKAIADPANATTIIQNATGLTMVNAKQLFQQFFIQGYVSAMLILVVISLMACAIVLFTMKSK